MSLVLCNQAETLALQYLLNRNLTVKLFENNKTPAETDTEADYTEATFTGYAAKTLTYANWNFTPGAPSAATYNAAQTWTSSAGSQDKYAYGYFVVQAADGKLLWAERFSDGPYHIVNNGDTVTLTPAITCD